MRSAGVLGEISVATTQLMTVKMQDATVETPNIHLANVDKKGRYWEVNAGPHALEANIIPIYHEPTSVDF